jgi:uncharacterized protein
MEPRHLALLVLQGTQFCNIDCRYCDLPNRNKVALMDMRAIEAVRRRLAGHPLLAPVVTLLWHAGEPLTAGVDYDRQAFDALSGLANSRYRFCIQTNGTLIADEFCELFKPYRDQIGISLDGPKNGGRSEAHADNQASITDHTRRAA